MAIKRWNPTDRITLQEENILKRCRRNRRLFVFLRENCREIMDDELLAQLESVYRSTGAGREPLCPGMMAMALILQGYHRVSDAEAVELTVVDLRWQMVLGLLGNDEPAFAQGTLFEFRQRLIRHDLDRVLLERTAAIARSTKGFDYKKLPKTLRIAVDSSPLEGAGRVEDTINLIGHAARKVVDCVATLLEWKFSVVCRTAGIPLLLEKSVKKALDRDWSDDEQKAKAVDEVARQVLNLERWLSTQLAEEVGRPPLEQLLATLRQLMDQDLEPDPNGGDGIRIADKVAKDRRISVEDEEMRHGRKSKTKRIDGYKRHIASDLDSGAVVACEVTPANVPEKEALSVLKDDLERQDVSFGELAIDRGYMGSPVVADLIDGGVPVLCKPWKRDNGGFFTKEDFDLNLRDKTITCPDGVTVKFEFGKTVRFSSDDCALCPLRDQCTSAAGDRGRTVSIALDERFQQRMRKKSKTQRGRQQFRDRVAVEHRLAHISQRQGNRARYCGTRKNLYDLRRAAAIQNLEIAQRMAA
jgi:hypothetical protein